MGQTNKRKVIQRLKDHAWIGGNPAIFGSIGFVIGFAYVGLLQGGVDGVVEKFFFDGIQILAPMLAAGAAFGSILLQIKETKVTAEEQRLAKLRAAKATLPLALSEIVRVSNTGVDYACKDPAFFKLPNSRSEYENATGISEDTLNVLKTCIEFADEQSAKWLAVVLQHYQVANARFLSHFDDPDMLYDECDQAAIISRWLIVKALTAHLFDFARGAETAPMELKAHLIRLPILAPWYHTSLGTEVSAHIESAKSYYDPFNVEKFVLLKDIHLQE
ncbi:hypothetical protein [Tritonibacter scottomollicae]|uniref:hypothetical protein n=1 Tax=Tritonibacter scottomollicae TaxID=483013 RepID=UPI003AA7C3B0